MTCSPLISVIICTANRAGDLQQTLDALQGVCVPDGLPTELLILDNASTDGTAQVAQNCRLPNMSVQHIYEGRRGKGFAYNRGMAEAQGRVLLFTDDDVRPPADWIAGMAGPILSGQADALVGGVRLAPHLERDWMQPLHRQYLASTQYRSPDAPGTLVGANMAFGRHVLERVPAFDTELGPGALGLEDESLFSRQLERAGFRVGSALDTVVEHHFDPSRLQRRHFLAHADKFGRSVAYAARHWEQREVRFAAARAARKQAHLVLRRLSRPAPDPTGEGMPEWEMNTVQFIAFYRHYLVECRRRPTYATPYALVKRTDG